VAYLLTQIVFLLLIAALLGGCFAWWLARRRFRNLSAEYAQMRGDWSQWRRDFEARLGERPQHDLAPVLAQLRAVEAAIGGIRLPEYEAPDLTPVLDAVGAIHIPVVEPVDLAPIESRLAKLAAALAAIRIPEAARPVDFAPVYGRIDRLEHAVRSIVIPVAKEHRDVDLGGVFQRLQEIGQQIEKIHCPQLPPTTPVDLAPVLRSLSALQARLDRPVMAAAAESPTGSEVGRQGSAKSPCPTRRASG
jgi:hypothetical protein